MNIRKAIHLLLITGCLWAVSGARAQDTLPRSPKAAYDVMLRAAKRMQDAERVIYRHKLALGIYLADLDLNRTGMVGADTSEITTTPGALTAKRSATNPDFAAYLVDLLRSQGLNSQDTVLVTMTGSLPGFNLAVVIALELLEIPMLRVSSLGSSAYGANQPQMTWIDIEDILYREGLIETRSSLITLGGTWDIGYNLSEESRVFLRGKCARLGYPLLETNSVKTQRALRLDFFGDPRRYALLINVGGNHLMLGDRDEDTFIPGGWIRAEGGSWNEYRTKNPEGIIFDYLDAGVPVLNLLHVENICKEAGIPYDPRPLPRVGASPVYFLRAQE